MCKPGDKLELRGRAREMALVLEALELPERDVPDYVDVDAQKMTATFVRVPAFGDVPYAVHMEPNLVVEYYSR
jgi:small subunit ribosomal protein S4